MKSGKDAETHGVVLDPTGASDLLRDIDHPRLCLSPTVLGSFHYLLTLQQLILGLINISPWLVAILYDLIYYISRQTWYYIPVYGGRARGDARPRAPSLRDRTRRRSIAEMIGGDTPAKAKEEHRAGLRENQLHRRNVSHGSIKEEEEDD